ncbi:MAG: nuclear transport factor 2 family protein [Pseudomonadota bacterium]
MKSLEERVRRLEACEDIRSLAARYTFAVDNRDLKAIAACFSEHARFRSKDGVLNAVGRDAIMAQFDARFLVLGPGAHYTHDHVVWFEKSNLSIARGLVSSHAELIRNGRPMITSLRYDDEYIVEDEKWVFSDRLLSFFYYLETGDYLKYLGDKKRMRAYDEPWDADFPEALASWRKYHPSD